LYLIFSTQIFPNCFIVGQGLTQFKIISEYVIIGILMFSAYLIIKQKYLFTSETIMLLLISIIVQILSGFSFTTFASLFGFSNFFGHFLKLIWIFIFFKAVITAALLSPSKSIYLALLTEAQLTHYLQQPLVFLATLL